MLAQICFWAGGFKKPAPLTIPIEIRITCTLHMQPDLDHNKQLATLNPI